MTSLLAVTFLLALTAPLVQATLWRVPFGLLSIRMVLRAVLLTAAITYAAGLMAASLLEAIPSVPEAHADPLGATTGGIVSFGFLLFTSMRLRRLRGALLLAHRLRETEVQQQALDALHALMRDAQPEREGGDWKEYASMVLLVVPPMTQAGLWGEAEQLLRELPIELLDDKQKGLRTQALATCRIQRGDLAGAREAVEELGGPTGDESVDPWLSTTRALLLACEGRADAALEAVGEETESDDPLLRASRRIVRAHAFAEQGEEDRAREELHSVVEEVGPLGLERALQPRGPASDIARAIQRERQESEA